MKKYCKIMLVMLALLTTQCNHGAVGEGFSKIWEGTKDVASGTWNTITSPFRSKKDQDKKTKNNKTVKSVSKVEKKKVVRSECGECKARTKKSKRKK